MRHFLKFITTTLLTISFCNFLFAQVDSSIIIETKNYSKYLDSLNKLDHPQNFGLATSIADGIIKRDDVIVGGFGIYTLSKGDTALRIEYHDNLDINIYKTYYYKSNKLIFATLELQTEETNAKTIYYKEEFYNDRNIIWTNTQKEKSVDNYFDKTNFVLFEDGIKYLDDFKKDNHRR